jgi:thiamine pyrophosphate-dependent acetolactate synthase large subunit-like protein
MKRIDAIVKTMKSIRTELVISSCGMISREVFFIKDRPENFYVQGSMGTTLGIGIGLALNVDREVVVIVGDGEILMSLGTLVLMNKLKLPNLRLIILDNGCYQSTGGQKTCSDAVNFSEVCNCEVIKVDSESEDVPRISLPHEEITRRFYHAINGV